MLIAESLLLWGVVVGMSGRIARVEQLVSEVADLRDPSPFRAALVGHLDAMQWSGQAFARSPDPGLPARVSESQASFESSLPEFAQANPRLFPPAAAETIRNDFLLFKSDVNQALQVSARRAERRQDWRQRFDRLLFLLDHRLRPLLRRHAEAGERLEGALLMENQLRAWAQSMEALWQEPTGSAQALAREHENRGSLAMDRFEAMDPPASERRVLKDWRSLWQANADAAREIMALGVVQEQALRRQSANQERLRRTITRVLPALQPGELQQRQAGLQKAIRRQYGLMGALVFGAAISAIAAVLLAWRWRTGLPLPPPNAPASPAEEEAMIEMDLQGRITRWSERARRLYGYAASEIIGQSIARLFATEAEIARLNQQLRSGRQLSFETQHRQKAGSVFPVTLQFRPLSGPDGSARGVSLICHWR